MLVGTDTILLCMFLSPLITTTEFGVTLSQVRIKIRSGLCDGSKLLVSLRYLIFIHIVGMNLTHLYAFAVCAVKPMNFPLSPAVTACTACGRCCFYYSVVNIF